MATGNKYSRTWLKSYSEEFVFVMIWGVCNRLGLVKEDWGFRDWFYLHPNPDGGNRVIPQMLVYLIHVSLLSARHV